MLSAAAKFIPEHLALSLIGPLCCCFQLIVGIRNPQERVGFHGDPLMMLGCFEPFVSRSFHGICLSVSHKLDRLGSDVRKQILGALMCSFKSAERRYLISCFLTEG